MDHPYYMSARKTETQARKKLHVQPSSSGSSQPLPQATVLDNIISIKPLFEHDWSREMDEEEESTMQDPEGHEEEEYVPQSDEENPSDHELSDTEEAISPDIGMFENNYIVFETCLDELHKFCKECGSPVVSSRRFTSGSCIAYQIECLGKHKYIWHSQPIIHRQPLGNLIFAAGILLTGNTYSRISAIANAVKLKFFSKSVFNRIQREKLFPVIQEAWLKERQSVVDELQSHPDLVLAGDGRCDSPGHCAKYGSYTFMHATGNGQKGTRKIVELQLVQSSQVSFAGYIK